MTTTIKDIIAYYTEHEVSDDIRERVLDRISGSINDQETDAAFRQLWNTADAAFMDEYEISAAYHQIQAKISEKPRAVTKRPVFTWTRFAAVLVPLLMLVVFGKIYIQMDNHLRGLQDMDMLQQHTVGSECKDIVLPDGTKVRLNSSSALLYPSFFQGKQRRVYLTGEAFFDVKHNDKQPFHVNTPYLHITDLGTSFTVSSYTDDETVSTTLKTGRIELRVAGMDRVYRMNPNDQLVYNVITKSVSIRQVPDDEDGMSWRNKELDLNDVTLSEAADVISRTYGVRFVFHSERYKKSRITVHFNRGETLSGVMSVVRNLIPGMEYEIGKNEVVVFK